LVLKQVISGFPIEPKVLANLEPKVRVLENALEEAVKSPLFPKLR
jgi:hypothetical protein